MYTVCTLIQVSLVLKERNIGSQSQSFGNTMINYQRESLCMHVSVFVSFLTCLFVYSIFDLHDSFFLFLYKYVCDSSWFSVCVSFFGPVCVVVCLSVCLCLCVCVQLQTVVEAGSGTAGAISWLEQLRLKWALPVHRCITCTTCITCITASLRHLHHFAKGFIRIPSLHHLHQTHLICLEGLASLHHLQVFALSSAHPFTTLPPKLWRLNPCNPY